MADKEVKIGRKVIGENTKIILSVKVALWLIGGIIFLFTTTFTFAYIDVKSDVREYKNQMEKDKSDFIQTVEEKLDEKLGVFQQKDEQFIKEIGDIKGDIKVILDRTCGAKWPAPNTIREGNTPPK